MKIEKKNVPVLLIELSEKEALWLKAPLSERNLRRPRL